MPLRAPFPWFGGKSRAASLIWERLGDVPNYVEPFAGSLAVLLGRPTAPKIETVNDLDGFVCNVWRALAADPEGVAKYANWPVNENDLTARHIWLVERRKDLTARLEGDPDYYDPKIAGWWLWGAACWIGREWCSGKGPWHVVDEKLTKEGIADQGIVKQIPHLGNIGRWVNNQGITSQDDLKIWFADLSKRLRRVKVCCGDWQRICTPIATTYHGVTAVVLDPPYSGTERDANLYAVEDETIAIEVRKWALENGNNPLFRIVLCGYSTEHDMPGWSSASWKALGGYGVQSSNRALGNARHETLWFSPYCLKAERNDFFDLMDLEESLCKP